MNFPITDTGTMSLLYRMMEDDVEDVQDLHQCYVSLMKDNEEVCYPESEMIKDNNGDRPRWFHKSKVKEYVSLCAEEFGWDEEEKQGAIKEFES